MHSFVMGVPTRWESNTFEKETKSIPSGLYNLISIITKLLKFI